MFTFARSIVRSFFGAAISLPLVAGGVGVASLAFAQPAAAQEPGPIQMVVQQCVEQIGTSAERTRNLLEARAEFGVQRIGNLDANDAPVPALLNAAQESRQDLRSIADDGARRINRIAGHCLRFLNQNDAPQQAIRVVLEARSAALSSIEAKHRMAQRQVTQALRSALEDEDHPGGGK